MFDVLRVAFESLPSERTIPADDAGRIAATAIRWHGPYKELSSSPQEQSCQAAADELDNFQQGIYLATGWRRRYFPQFSSVAYIGSTSNGSRRWNDRNPKYGLNKLRNKGRLTGFWIGEIRTPPMGRTVRTTSSETAQVTDHEIAEHLLISFYNQNTDRKMPYFNSVVNGRRNPMRRLSFLWNDFSDLRLDKGPLNMPDVIAFDERDRRLFAWWLSRSGKNGTTGRFRTKSWAINDVSA